MKTSCIIVLLVLLLIVVIKEKYPRRIWNRLFPPAAVPYSYTQNPGYYELLELHKAYIKQGDIVMLGNSIISRVSWDELLGTNTIVNRGIGTDVTEGVRNRLGTVYSANPKTCFIEIGINDIEYKVPDKMILDNYSLIIDSLQAHSIEVIPFLVLYVSQKYPNYQDVNRKVSSLNILLTALFKTKKLRYINLNTVLAPQGILKDEYAQKDGIHLTVKAYLLWKQILMQYI